jgi:DNA polymerase-3 subunit gamma/tau
MSYLVLARKYRPRTFSEVAGQETAMRTLQGAIAEQRVGHAYLFCGPRGTGKTTTARILAKALLCEKGPTAEPCLTCDQCRDTESGANVDVIEFDAASNTGVDDVRMLKEAVGFAPMRARFKVYIIDEVHMMSKAAFNALLKTLEEPPPHVKFLFATTELDKVLETVRSRCQIVRLSLIPEVRIAAHLDGVLAKEGISPEPGVTAELARFARGSLRDGLSITDQLLALVGDRPSVEDVRRVAPQGGAEQVEALLVQVEAGDRAGVLAALPKTDGGEAELCGALLAQLRLGLVCLLCPADAALHESDEKLRTRLAERAKRLGTRSPADLARGTAARARAHRAPAATGAHRARGDAARPVPAREHAAARAARGASGRARSAPCGLRLGFQSTPPSVRAGS